MNTPSLPLSCSSALLRFAVQVIVIIHLASDQPLLSTAASSLVCSLLMGLFFFPTHQLWLSYIKLRQRSAILRFFGLAFCVFWSLLDYSSQGLPLWFLLATSVIKGKWRIGSWGDVSLAGIQFDNQGVCWLISSFIFQNERSQINH